MATTVQPTGQLNQVFSYTRQWANEPAINAKYTDDKLYPVVRANYRELLGEMLRLSDIPFVVQYSFAVTNDTNTYLMPPNIGTIYRLGIIDPVTGRFSVELFNMSRKNPFGSQFQFDGTNLTFNPIWTGGSVTMTLEYIQNGDVEMCLVTQANPGAVTGNDASHLVLFETAGLVPTVGYFDYRPNAYYGSMVRLLGASHNPTGYKFWPTQTRPIINYTPTYTTGPRIEVRPVFDFNPATVPSITSLTYEIVPEGLGAVTPVLGLRSAIFLHRTEGNLKRVSLLTDEYKQKLRDIRLGIANMDAIRGGHWESDATYRIEDLWNIL